MSNFIKYYRKKDSESKEATHQAIFADNTIEFRAIKLTDNIEASLKGKVSNSASFRFINCPHFPSCENFDEFIIENNFEEIFGELANYRGGFCKKGTEQPIYFLSPTYYQYCNEKILYFESLGEDVMDDQTDLSIPRWLKDNRSFIIAEPKGFWDYFESIPLGQREINYILNAANSIEKLNNIFQSLIINNIGIKNDKQ